MGRAKTVVAKPLAAKPPAAKSPNARKAPVAQSGAVAKPDKRRLPLNKLDMAELAKYQPMYSKKTLATRIRSLSAENRALFTKFAGVDPRTVRRWAQAGTHVPWSDEVRHTAQQHWKRLVHFHLHAATMDMLQDEVELSTEELVPVRTLKSWVQDIGKPPAPAYVAPSNDPTFYYKIGQIQSQ